MYKWSNVSPLNPDTMPEIVESWPAPTYTRPIDFKVLEIELSFHASPLKGWKQLYKVRAQ